MSLGGSMAKTSHRSSKGCVFDPRIGSEIVFLRIELDKCLSIISICLQVLTALKCKSHQYHH